MPFDSGFSPRHIEDFVSSIRPELLESFLTEKACGDALFLAELFAALADPLTKRHRALFRRLVDEAFALADGTPECPFGDPEGCFTRLDQLLCLVARPLLRRGKTEAALTLICRCLVQLADSPCADDPEAVDFTRSAAQLLDSASELASDEFQATLRNAMQNTLVKLTPELRDALLEALGIISASRPHTDEISGGTPCPVSLNELVCAFDSNSAWEESETFLDRETGELCGCSHESLGEAEEIEDPDTWEPAPDLPDWQVDEILFAHKILSEQDDDRYLRIPGGELYRDWDLMLDFAHTQPVTICHALENALHRKGAYRQFRQLCDRYGLTDAWDAYERTEKQRLVLKWCAEMGIVPQQT